MSKIGVHAQYSSPVTGPAMDWAIRAPIVKQMDGTGALRAAQAGSIKVYRKYFSAQPLRDPIAYAASIIQDLGGYHDENLYVELFNEIYQDRPLLDDYITWTEAATMFLHESGYKVAGFSFSTGNPTVYPDAWLYLQSRGYAGVDSISMHEYWNGKTGSLTLWNALRHRMVHEWTNGQHPSMIITECGADAVEGGPSGWKLCGISANQYVAQLAAYEFQINQDDYVLGATVFGGSPTADWAQFSTDGLAVGAFAGLPPRTHWEPTGGSVPPTDTYTIDAETRAAIADRGWTPAGSYDSTPEAYGLTVCVEGLCYYLNGPALYRFVPFS